MGGKQRPYSKGGPSSLLYLGWLGQPLSLGAFPLFIEDLLVRLDSEFSTFPLR